jgi:hypothetical protein
MNPRIVASGIGDLLPMERSGEPHRHVSAIIRSLCIALGHFEDDAKGKGTDNAKGEGPDQTRMELGSAFEDALASALADRYARSDPDRYVRPGPLEKDGLIGNMDLLDVTDWAVIEIKLTWISSRHPADSEKFWKYWVQLKAYCTLVGTRLGRLHVCHINGDYKGSRGPVYNVWEDEFSEQELAENWRMLVTQSEAMSAIAQSSGKDKRGTKRPNWRQ